MGGSVVVVNMHPAPETLNFIAIVAPYGRSDGWTHGCILVAFGGVRNYTIAAESRAKVERFNLRQNNKPSAISAGGLRDKHEWIKMCLLMRPAAGGDNWQRLRISIDKRDRDTRCEGM